MGLISSVRDLFRPVPTTERDFMPWVTFNGNTYPLGMLQQTLQGNREDPPHDFSGIVNYLFKNNAVVFACQDNRAKLFSEARLKYRRLQAGRPGELWGDASLSILERPWPGGTTGDLLAKMLQSADLEGDAFVVRLNGTLTVPRPDWMTIVLDGDVRDLGAEPSGYVYWPGGKNSGAEPVPLDVRQVAHFAPIPDPLTPHRGMSWLTPIVREVMADTAATSHKLKFFENGATPNLVVSLDPSVGKAAFDEWVKAFRAGHEGTANAYKTLFMGGGAKVEAVGKDLQQVEFKVTQGAGETRIAAAAGVPPVIVGLSEGLAAATYSNYGQARRRFADQTMRPLWRNAAASLAAIVAVPGGSELWYDDRDISALQEDQKDAADILSVNVGSIVSAVNGGFEPDTAIAAITSGDLTLLKHTGLTSVQLQPPASEDEPPEPEPEDDVEDDTEDAPEDEPTPPARSELLEYLLTARTEAAAPTFAEGAIRVEAPVTVNLPEQAAPTVVIEEGAVSLVQKLPVRSVIDRDEDGVIVGSHEEVIE